MASRSLALAAIVGAALVSLTGCIVLPPSAGSVSPTTQPDVEPSATSEPASLPEPIPTEVPQVSETPAPPVETQPPAEPAPPAEPELTLAQQNAVGSAESYLDFMHFSRSGLIGQLEYEGFATADATFAVDSLAVDWNQQAAGSAQDYLDFMTFSRQGLIDQLLYEGFSQAEAEFGVSAVGY